ncbi:phenylalanine--tRNA ligase subunit beta [Sphingomonas desiccabilis]|uniref:Phenylalanine--tRNA ligase beta subunit n=1 Tax=Sphingomonas desiccabilis TaxID=429134 RepID=A0A4Q2IP04_9SPHN|nr:phenylalanine--tRNA ligase subunit beta [Sphingomonas desiccabilis]MBB3911955.1 phenylalanyl-tRNA synthetase beta chain [Sphingomonas desiccabilis]RXZ31343.1 phenylalanine--tRNA ligase subunit beta [Sphingomonas desiccabilis]
MKFTVSWLREHLDTDASLDAILDGLTRIGLEVEGVENPAARLTGFRVARVLTAERHPQADKLQVLSVDAGDGPLQVVCGAPNARAGLVGVFGMPGAVVPANGMELRVAAIRGVESNGMMCSTRELELGEDHDGIIELPADAPVGTTFADYAGLDDPVIDVAITPNRQDCMGVRGIARDLAAAGLGTLRPLEAVLGDLPQITPQGAGPDVATHDPEGCPAFFAQTVAGVTNGPSPDWLQRRLTAVGQKPISALVDITNYVMLGLGRPLHVYDRAKLQGGLVARHATAGEQVLALNGKTYTLDGGETVIADDAAVHDIGGIMGGEHSGVSETTTDVLIECAYFTPETIARTGQKLALTSDARQRFERGVDPAFLDEGLAIATRLVLALCGGTPSEVTRAGEPPADPRLVAYNPNLSETLGGLAVAPERQQEILERLGFVVDLEWNVVVPSWRRDVDGPADLVEEVIRIEGIDKVPSTPLPRPAGVARPTATPEQKLERRLRRSAAARGLNEAITWSFIAEDAAASFGGGAWTLANPISEDMKVMRPSLLPGLLSAANRNLKRGATGVRLFEIGRRYLADGERLTLGVVLAGEQRSRGWQAGKAAPFDAFDAKAEALALLEAAGAPVANLQVMDGAGDAYHPGQSATLRLGPKTVLAAFGTLHPRLAKAFDLSGSVVAVELFLDALPGKRGTGFMRPAYAPPALQAVTRDFAFLVPATVSGDALVRAVRGADKAAIVDARLFDVFTGAGVEEGSKSLAVEVTLQPGEKSFTDAEIKGVADKVVAAAAKLGASLRG